MNFTIRTLHLIYNNSFKQLKAYRGVILRESNTHMFRIRFGRIFNIRLCFIDCLFGEGSEGSEGSWEGTCPLSQPLSFGVLVYL